MGSPLGLPINLIITHRSSISYVVFFQNAGTRKASTAKNSRRPRIIKIDESSKPKSERKAHECIGPAALKETPVQLIMQATSPMDVSISMPLNIYSIVPTVEIEIITRKKHNTIIMAGLSTSRLPTLKVRTVSGRKIDSTLCWAMRNSI